MNISGIQGDFVDDFSRQNWDNKLKIHYEKGPKKNSHILPVSGWLHPFLLEISWPKRVTGPFTISSNGWLGPLFWGNFGAPPVKA